MVEWCKKALLNYCTKLQKNCIEWNTILTKEKFLCKRRNILHLKKLPKLKEVYYFIKSSLIMFYHVNQGCHKRSGAEDFPSQIPSYLKGKQNYWLCPNSWHSWLLSVHSCLVICESPDLHGHHCSLLSYGWFAWNFQEIAVSVVTENTQVI